ncbi:MAG: SRPBCC domain-containing protein [Deltaproteobacteria bacterium]|jgi:uncharacterized protein YndB with AHSA1/START domain|nr:SRPBCC domain-containing protein [Deltaproteobacteria bacterium]
MAELSLTVSRTIDAPIESVYNAWLDPDTLAKFMLPGPGMSVPSAENDAREGGRFSILMQGKDDSYPHGGEYLSLKPYSQIIFTWESPFSIDGSTVTINLNDVSGGTLIELTHVKFADEESRNNYHGGWTSILECLEDVLK